MTASRIVRRPISTTKIKKKKIMSKWNKRRGKEENKENEGNRDVL